MKILKNVKLNKYTTFHTGGPAKYFAVIKNTKELKKAIEFADKKKLKIFTLGGGSNILIRDDGIDGIVLLIQMKGSKLETSDNGPVLKVKAGESWDKIVAKAVKRGLSGIENLSLIPGSLGGAICQNIGAYGVELKDVLESVTVFDISDKTIKTLTNKDCQFGYRTSIFQNPHNKGYVILGGVLKLSTELNPNLDYQDLKQYFENKTPTLGSVRNAVIKIRKSKLVYPTKSIGTVGSFFKNPVITSAEYEKLLSDNSDIKGRDIGDGLIKLFAGQLIEKAGWKGRKIGKAGVSAKHALVLVSYKGAKSEDILRVADEIQKTVKSQFGITLEPEARVVG